MELLASGNWVTRERLRIIAVLACTISILCIGWLFATSRGTLDLAGRPLGTDFSNVWAAGRMALDGRAAEAWSWADHFAVQQALHGRGVPLFGWHYPPPFLLIAALLASIPYVPALIMWQAATLAPFAAMMWRVMPRAETLILTLGAPVTLICLTHGHNGFLTALLLGGGLMLLDKRPMIAGLLFGCLLYKPQFALIIPPLLIAGRSWRAIGGACVSSGFLIGATLLVWGWPVWQAFAESLALTRQIVIEQGSTGWHKIMSPFAAMRMWGAGLGASYVCQLLVTLAAVVGVSLLARRKDCPELRNALVCAAALLSTPYVLDYDFVVLLPALAWLWSHGRAHGFMAWDKTLLLFAWFAPLAARAVAEWTLVPLGLMTALIVAGIAIRRALCQGIAMPPFTWRVWPVTYPASRLAR